jgi:Protein of unknown function with HXXEE motif
LTWLSWAPLIAAALHVGEEFVWPGGFLVWYRRYRPQIANSLTTRFAVVVNGILLLACLISGLLGNGPQGVALWLTVVSVLLSNVAFHVLASIRTGAYCPGLVTAVLLYLPLGLFGYWYFVNSGLSSRGTALTALIVGGSYPALSLLNHRRRRAARHLDDLRRRGTPG